MVLAKFRNRLKTFLFNTNIQQCISACEARVHVLNFFLFFFLCVLLMYKVDVLSTFSTVGKKSR